MARPKGLEQSERSKKRISEAQKIRYQMMKEELARKHGQYFKEEDDSKLDAYESLQAKLRKSIAAFTSALMDLANFNTQPQQHSGETTAKNTNMDFSDEKLDNVVRASIRKIMNEKGRR